MASTITAGSLTVKITEAITLNGSDMGSTNTFTVGAINEINQRIVSLDSGNLRTLFEFGTVIGSGTFVKAEVQYVRITNKDDTNAVSLNLATAASNCWVDVAAGQSLMVSRAVSTAQGVASGTVGLPVLADLVKITGYSANSIDLDCYIALA
jgi:hypothetical protein|tara:strand:- start:118 stop:573 length:456 start_codon:yes stop_codon:yes gene_type:complete